MLHGPHIVHDSFLPVTSSVIVVLTESASNSISFSPLDDDDEDIETSPRITIFKPDCVLVRFLSIVFSGALLEAATAAAASELVLGEKSHRSHT